MKHQTSQTEEKEEKNPLVLQAMHEIELAKLRERKNSEPDDAIMVGYVDACYDSALKAYKSLADDGHSGMSWGITCRILESLMHEIPLTPIEDVPESWSESRFPSVGKKTYQCVRRGSLFKDVFDDGHVEYHDNDNQVLDEVKLDDGHIMGLGSSRTKAILKKYAPEALELKFPYMPSRYAWRVRISEDILGNRDFDMFYLHFIKKPSQEKIYINKIVVYDGSKIIEPDISDIMGYGINMEEIRRKMEKVDK